MKLRKLDGADRELIAAAEDVLRRNHHPDRHSVGAAVRCESGRIHVGINVEACGYGPCAEPIAIGAAFATGERQIKAIVAVAKRNRRFIVIPPCGNCRQLLVDYSPRAMVILPGRTSAGKATAASLLPVRYRSGFGV